MKNQPNRCDVYLKVYISNVPVGLTSEEYIEYLQDDIEDGVATIADHETAEAWYDKDHDGEVSDD